MSKNKTELMTAAAGCAIIGAMAGPIFGATLAGYGMQALGIGVFAYEFMNKRGKGKHSKFWEAHNLIVERENTNLYPEILEEIETQEGTTLKIKMPLGLSSDNFTKKAIAIKEHFNAKDIDFNYNNGFLFIKLKHKELQNKYEFKAIDTKGILELVVGYSYKGAVRINLTDGSPHILLAGETGSGKSTELRAILTTLVITKDPNKLRLHLIDLKQGAELGIFKKCKHVESFSKNPIEAEKQLNKILKEVKRRYVLFEEKDCVDIKEYNKKFKFNKLNYHLIVIDEFALLKTEKDSLGALEELAATARACGIHLLISTQRPSATIINGDIKANVPIVIGLKAMNNTNSMVIWDKGGLEKLRGKGHGYVRCNGEETEIQSMLIEPEEARDLLKPYYNNFVPAEKKEEKKEIKSFDFLDKL